MTTKRATIGRTFSQSPLHESVSDAGFTQQFTFASGKSAVFTLESIIPSKVATDTFVMQENNGRDQAALTSQSLRDITRTLRLQQFFPAVGRRINGRIEILDGSRRRAAAMLCQTGLNILVTDVDISADDARQLAKDIQTAKEHNLRETGIRLSLLLENGMTRKEIAEAERLSASRVTRAIQAATVPAAMLTPFPDISELNYPDYRYLLDVHEQFRVKKIAVTELTERVTRIVSGLPGNNTVAPDDLKQEIIRVYRAETAAMLAKPPRDKAVNIKLWEFSDKDSFARKKIKGRSFSYEFNRLPRSLQDDLDEAIAETIRKYYA